MPRSEAHSTITSRQSAPLKCREIELKDSRDPAFEPREQDGVFKLQIGASRSSDPVIEEVSGQSYYDYLKANVFRPPVMADTEYPLREDMNGTALGYTRTDGEALKESTDQLPWRGTPAGGGVSKAGDMVSTTIRSSGLRNYLYLHE